MSDRAVSSYREAVRIQERLIDFQVRAYEFHHRIAGEFMRVAMDSLAGILAVVGLLSASGFALMAPLFWPSVVAVLLVVLGLAILLGGYGGYGTNQWLEVGPDPGRIAQAARDAPEVQLSLLASLVDNLDTHFDHNRSILSALVRWRLVALLCNIVGVAVFLAALAFIVGGGMYA